MQTTGGSGRFHPGVLALQYWFFWVYNDWNDRHEGDWEMVQLLFDAPDAAAALTGSPTELAYAQHEGGETASWEAAKVRKVDGRPTVFPGSGSHAAYYSSSRWFGKSAQTGFGCDDTRGPIKRVQPEVVMLPDTVSGPDDPFAWLTFTGRWGEKQPSFNNGPTGPNTKTQWAKPVTWQEEEGRDGALSLPPLGGRATDMFCSASRQGSLLFIRLLANPILVTGVLGVAVVGLVLGLRRTQWSPVEVAPIPQRRTGGQIVRSAWRLVRRHFGLYLRIGAAMVAGGVAAAVVQAVLVRFTPLGAAVDVLDGSSTWAATVILFVTALITLPVTLLVVAAAAAATRELAAGQQPSALASLRSAVRPPGGWLAGVVLALVLLVSAGSLLLIPVGLWLVSRCCCSSRASASRSSTCSPA